MDREQAKELIPIMTAYANGETVQYRTGDKWHDAASPTFSGPDWRIKPKPVTRPWSKPEDVPGPVCWTRNPKTGGEAMIVRLSKDGIVNWCSDWGAPYAMQETTWDVLVRCNVEYSTDRKTWHPCTVTDPA